MGALMDENPPYRVTFHDRGKAVNETWGRDELRSRVEGLRKAIGSGSVTDMKVTNRFGDDVTVDWFG